MPRQITKHPQTFCIKNSDSHNHQVAVYNPQSLGRGRRIIYRENQGNFSTAESEYQKHQNHIRQNQSYLYSEFVVKSIYDIKVYLVDEFIFAQSRITPFISVQKNSNNSQLRLQVKLTEDEKQICYKIAKRFKMPICSIDILRSNQKSYVCDINGWSFATADGLKQNVAYYWEIVSNILKNMILKEFMPEKAVTIDYKCYDQYIKKQKAQEIAPIVPKIKQNQLRAVVSITCNSISTKIDQLYLNQVSSQTQQRCKQIGSSMRNEFYDDIDSLKLHATFQHQIQTFAQPQKKDIILAGSFLKGFFGIQGELSPALVSMVNTDFLNSTNQEKSKFMDIMMKIISDFQRLLFVQDQFGVQLNTYIYFEPRIDLDQLVSFFKKNITKLSYRENLYEYKSQIFRQIESITQFGLKNIYFKLYQIHNQISEKEQNLSDKWYIQMTAVPMLSQKEQRNAQCKPVQMQMSQFKEIFGFYQQFIK